MSNNDSIDEETKRILAEVDSNDSTESKENKNKGKTWIEKNKQGTDVEYNDEDTPDDEW